MVMMWLQGPSLLEITNEQSKQDKKFSVIPPSRLNRGRYDHKISWGVILE